MADIWDVGLLLLGGCMVAVSVNLFLAPARIPDGTMLLLGMIAQHLFGLVLGTAMLLLRIPGLFFGFRYLRPWPFLLRTGFTALVVTFAIDLSAERFALVSANPILNVLFGGALTGLGMELIFRGGGNTGGTGVYARILQLVTGWPLSQLYLFVDSVILLSGFFFGSEAVMHGVLALFVSGMVANYVLEGPSVVRTATVITEHPDAVAAAILHELRRGVTAWRGAGMFSGRKCSVLICTVSRSEVESLWRLVLRTDPHCFLVIGNAQQASGGVLRDAAAHPQVGLALPHNFGCIKMFAPRLARLQPRRSIVWLASPSRALQPLRPPR